LTETQREPEREVGSGFNTPREDVDEATAMYVVFFTATERY
jgi:hypothetical protein